MAERGRRSGVEQEYTVRSDSWPVDFRALVFEAGRSGRRLDPGDLNAHRGAWGGVITADGSEAEIATPPVRVRPGFAGQLADLAYRGRDELKRVVPAYDLCGYSTHISVEVDDAQCVSTARRVVDHYALSLMLLLDHRESPGILIRPRRGRVEVCGDFVSGQQLQAAVLFTAAAVVDCNSRRTRRPRAPRALVVPSRNRFGWYVDRRSFGVDLYAGGREALVDRRVAAQDVFEVDWHHLRATASALASAQEVGLVDAVVSCAAPLPLEEREVHEVNDRPSVHQVTSHGSILADRRRAGFVIRARHATWSATVFELIPAAIGVSIAVLRVPDLLLNGFLNCLDNGLLDEHLRALDTVPAPILASIGDSGAPNEISIAGPSMIDPNSMSPDERDPVTGRVTGSGWHGGGQRRQKHRSEDAEPSRRLLRRWIRPVVVAAALTVVAAIALAFAAARRSDHQTVEAGPGSTTAGGQASTGAEPRIQTQTPPQPAPPGFSAVAVTIRVTEERFGQLEAPPSVAQSAPEPKGYGVGTSYGGWVAVRGCVGANDCNVTILDDNGIISRGLSARLGATFSLSKNGDSYTLSRSSKGQCDGSQEWTITQVVRLALGRKDDLSSLVIDFDGSVLPMWQTTGTSTCFGASIKVSVKGSSAS